MDGSISKLIPLVFITLLCLASVESGYLAVEHYILTIPEKTTPEKQKTGTSATGTKEKQVVTKDIDAILERQLFGSSESATAEEEPEQDEEKNLEASDLEVILMGTVKDEIGGHRAFILDKTSRKQKIYKVGDSLEGALVDKILRGKVILVSNGKNEILDMNKAAEVRSTYNRRQASPARQSKTNIRRPVRRVNTQQGLPARNRRVIPQQLKENTTEEETESE